MTESTAPGWLLWTERVIAMAGIAVVVWVATTAWGAVVHGHPAYAVLLGLTVLVSAAVLALSWRGAPSRRGWRRVLRVAAAVGGLAWVALMGWLRPFTAVEPALAALESDASVLVTETPTQIIMVPNGPYEPTALEFQPGARVDARAYAAVLRPLAEAGFPVVITKQPLGIGFLALGGLDQARGAIAADEWVVGGHSLGGTVAALTAANAPDGDVAGLVLYASYPAGDMSDFGGSVLSVSGSLDGLSTPEKIDASRADLPTAAQFTQIEGAVHAQFGDYGAQPGDGTPTMSDDVARTQITGATRVFLLGEFGPGQD